MQQVFKVVSLCATIAIISCGQENKKSETLALNSPTNQIKGTTTQSVSLLPPSSSQVARTFQANQEIGE